MYSHSHNSGIFLVLLSHKPSIPPAHMYGLFSLALTPLKLSPAFFILQIHESYYVLYNLLFIPVDIIELSLAKPENLVLLCHSFKNFVLFYPMPQQGLQQVQKQIEGVGLLDYQARPSFRDGVAHGGR